MPDSDKHSRLNVAILDDLLGICASSTPVTCGGYFPKFFFPYSWSAIPNFTFRTCPFSSGSTQLYSSCTITSISNQLHTILSASIQLYSSYTFPTTPSKSQSENHVCQVEIKEGTQKGQQETTTAIIVENCDLPSEQCEEQWVGGLTKKDQAIISSSLHVYCSCRMPEQAGSTMIQCSTCKEWFNVGVCVDVPIQAFDSATKWFCNKCNY